jgi:hypothetical protein
MKRILFYAMLVVVVSAAVAACQKEKILVLGDQHVKTDQSGELFHIRCALLSEGTVTLDVFHGGDEAVEFSYSWDGQVTNPFPDSCTTCKQIEIRLTGKGTNQDTDTLSYSQTVTIKLSDLNISTDDLNGGTILKIMNTSDEKNPVYLHAANGIARGGECTWTIDGGDGDGEIITVDPDLIYGLLVVVVETSCDKGAWKNLWLKTDLSEQDSVKPSFTYLMPVSIYLADSLYGYTPKIGDRLTGSFKKVKSDEVCADRIADTQPVNIISLYKR